MKDSKDKHKRSRKKFSKKNFKTKKKSENRADTDSSQSFNQKLRELVKKYKGYDPWEKEHRAKSNMEREVCRVLDNAGIEHKHRVKRYNVVSSIDREAIFEPDIIIPHPRINNKPILVHSLTDEKIDKQIPIITEFKKQLGLKYYVILVTRKDKIIKIPGESHDLLVAAEYIESLPSRIMALIKNRTS